MKSAIHIRQFSFTPHSWSDLYDSGFTSQKLAPEINGLRKNVLKFQLPDSDQYLYLHHWMICDENLLHDQIKIGVLDNLPVPENLECHFQLINILVAENTLAENYRKAGLPSQAQEPGDRELQWKIRKREPTWALHLKPLTTFNFNLPSTGPSSSFKMCADSHTVIYQSESHCLDFLISDLRPN